MRLCLINSFMWKMGGAAVFCREMVKGFSLLSNHKDDELFFLCEKMPRSFYKQLQDCGVNIVETGFSGVNSGGISAAKGWMSLLGYSKKIAKILAKIKPDLINPHIHMQDVFYATYYKAHKDKDVKILWYCHEPSRQLYDPYVLKSAPISERLFFSFYRSIFASMDIKYVRSLVDDIGSNSKYTADLVYRTYARTSQVIYPGIDVNLFSPLKTTLKNELDCESLILSVSNLDFAGKNPQIIPPILNKLMSKYDVKWIHIGRGPDETRFLKLAKIYDVCKSLKVIDYVTEEEAIKYYSSADIVVYTSIREPFGLVPLEAMACGTPVVASKYGGTSETVLNKKTGLLVDMNSPKEVLWAISHLLKNKCFTEKMGNLGRKRVCREFDLKNAIKEFWSFIYS